MPSGSGTELGLTSVLPWLGLHLDSRLRELAILSVAESFKELRLALKEARVGLRLGEGDEVEVASACLRTPLSKLPVPTPSLRSSGGILKVQFGNFYTTHKRPHKFLYCKTYPPITLFNELL